MEHTDIDEVGTTCKLVSLVEALQWFFVPTHRGRMRAPSQSNREGRIFASEAVDSGFERPEFQGPGAEPNMDLTYSLPGMLCGVRHTFSTRQSGLVQVGVQ